jgi:outer membrane protein
LTKTTENKGMQRKTLSVLVAALVASPCAWSLDLMQVYKEAVANDSQFAAARASLVAGQEKLPQGRALLLPTAGLSANRSRNDAETNFADSRYNTTNYGVQLTQPLFRWANWQQYEQSKLAVAVAEAQFALSRQDLILRVSQAYFDLLAAQDTLSFARAQKTAVSEQLAAARRNFEVGTATITDTHEAQARFDLATAQELAAEGDVQVRRTALQQIIGRVPAELARLRDKVALPAPQPAAIEEWVQGAEKQNFNVAQSELNREIARREIERNRAGHYPTVDLTASVGRSRAPTTTFSTVTTDVTSKAVGVSLNLPLFAGGAVQSRVREAIALEERAREDLETARRAAAQGARQAFVGVNTGLAQVRALEAAEISSQSALESNKLGYQVGVRINIDVLNAQQQLFQTRRDLAKARYDTLIAGLRLKAAAGVLNEEDVEAVNRLLTNG